MARYTTTIRTTLEESGAFAYMADFSNARFWDPSVSEARREDEGPVGRGSRFHLVVRFAGRDVPLTYTIIAFEPPTLVVLEARRGFVSRDTITVQPAEGGGSVVRYDALLAFEGIGRLLDPVMQLAFDRVGARAAAGLARVLNR
jgi:hypothetical protein